MIFTAATNQKVEMETFNEIQDAPQIFGQSRKISTIVIALIYMGLCHPLESRKL